MLQEMRNEEYEMEEEESLAHQNNNDISTAEQVELGDKEKEDKVFRYNANSKVICITEYMNVFRMNTKKSNRILENKAKNIRRSKTEISKD